MKKTSLMVCIVVLVMITGCLDNIKSDNESTAVNTTQIKETETDIDVVDYTEINDTEVVIDTEPTTEPTPTVADNNPDPISTATEIRPTATVLAYEKQIGQSSDNGQTKITVNNIRLDKSIGVDKPQSRFQFLILNISLENIGYNEISYSTSQFIILDTDEDIETIYAFDNASSNLANRLNGVAIKPSDKRSGELAFQVPENAKGLMLRFEYSDSTSEFFSLD